MNTLAIGLAGLGLAATIGRLRGSKIVHEQLMQDKLEKVMKIADKSLRTKLCLPRKRELIRGVEQLAKASAHRRWAEDGDLYDQAWDALSIAAREWQVDCGDG